MAFPFDQPHQKPQKKEQGLKQGRLLAFLVRFASPFVKQIYFFVGESWGVTNMNNFRELFFGPHIRFGTQVCCVLILVRHGKKVTVVVAFRDHGEPPHFQGSRDKDGCTPNSVPMVFIVFSRDSWGL